MAQGDIDLESQQINEVVGLLKDAGNELYHKEQLLYKRKTNYIFRLLPEVYGTKHSEGDNR